MLCAGACGAGAATAEVLPATFTVLPGGEPIPPSFQGVSVEERELGQFESMGPQFNAVLSLIRPRDGSPMILRIGGGTADHTLWGPSLPQLRNVPYPLSHVPSYLSVIAEPWVTSLAQMVRQDRLDVLLDLNLAAQNPRMEVSFAEAVHRALGPRLTGLQIGNEPDLYSSQPQLVRESRYAHGDLPGKWNVRYSAGDYQRDYIGYARALRLVLPHVELGGPDLITGALAWVHAIQSVPSRLAPGLITIHRYPEASCFPPPSPYRASIPILLSNQSSNGLAYTVANAVQMAHSRHETLRLTEFNSVSCGGTRGVADTFATTLWSLDAMLQMIKTGVDGLNWHVRPSAINTPFTFDPAAGGIDAMPELYGLAVFAQLTGAGATIRNGMLTKPKGLNLKVWDVQSRGSTKVVLLNKGSHPSVLRLRLHRTGTGMLRRLTAPEISSASGVTFGGQTIGPDARWEGPVQVSRVPAVRRQYTITLPPYSGAVLDLPAS